MNNETRSRAEFPETPRETGAERKTVPLSDEALDRCSGGAVDRKRKEPPKKKVNPAVKKL